MVREAGVRPLGTAQSGADAVEYLATSADLKNTTGKYFNVKTEARANAQAYDPDARKKLEEMVGGSRDFNKNKKTCRCGMVFTTPRLNPFVKIIICSFLIFFYLGQESG